MTSSFVMAPTANDPTFAQETPHALLERTRLTPDERLQLLEGYVTRGRALKLQGDRGLPDSHRRRLLNLGQFFTPSRLAHLLGQAIGLVDHPAWRRSRVARDIPAQGSITDFAGCGNGRLFQIAPQGWTCHGADVDPLACRAARLIYPEAEILNTSLLEVAKQQQPRFSVALINPPFSITLNRQSPLDLRTAQWGIWGRNTSVLSHLAAVELASSLAPVVGAILPTSSLAAGDFDAIFAKRDWRNRSLPLQLRIDLPSDAFQAEGTEWPCSVVLLADLSTPPLTRACADWTVIDAALDEWITSQAKAARNSTHGRNVLEVLYAPEHPSLANCLHVAEAPRPPLRVIRGAGATHHWPTVRLALGGRAHMIRLQANGSIAAHAIEEARHRTGWITSEGFSPQNLLDWECDLVRNAGGATRAVQSVSAALAMTGAVEVLVDEQLRRHAARSDRRVALELSDFAQHVRDGERWIVRGYDPISEPDHPMHALALTRFNLFHRRAEHIPTGATIPRWDRRRKAHIAITWPSFPIYEFARADIARALTKRAVIYSAKQGLGKTRFSIGAVIAAGVTHALWVLETRLVDEFRRELRKLGLADHFHLIETKQDLRELKTFNVITYSTLRKALNGEKERKSGQWGPGKTFAAALARRRLLVIIDEAHKLAAATSKQGIAGRHLCNHARRVILMTGTALRNYPRNLLGLAAAGWGDGAMMPYGYRRPVHGGYSVTAGSGRQTRQRHPLVRGVTRFVDEFVDVFWYTPEFQQTASSGMKSREIPRVKNPLLWESFVRPKILRRLPAEPEVRACIKTPEAKPIFTPVPPTPEHFAHYKLVLDRFASIWKQRLAREREGGQRENSAAHILPELDALRFASTVPIVHHPWADADPKLHYRSTAPTALMRVALERIAAWVNAGDRVIVGAEKPDALRWLRDLLADLPTYVPDADPIAALLGHDSNIARRNALIDRARDDASVSVLLLSVGMGKEGLNLGYASKLLTLDVGWVPGDLDQYRHRILRPDQVGDPEIVHLFHTGMVDAYMVQLCQAKEQAITAAIDGQKDTFDYSQWRDYRTFALEMLRDEGYAFAAEALERAPLAA